VDRVKRVIALAKLEVEKARARWGFFDVAYRTFKRFGEDDGATHAASLTYYTFFSIFPLLLFSAAALGYLTLGNGELRDQLLDSGLKTIPILSGALSPGGLERIEENVNGLAVTGTLLALYTGSGVIIAMQHSLNKIYHVDDEPNALQKRLRSLMWLAVLGVFALASLALTTVSELAPDAVASVLSLLGGLAVNIALFSTAYKMLPATTLSWKEVLPGAIVAAIGFEILKIAGTAYLARGESARDETFGAFAAAAALLIASFIIARVVLLAAEVNAVLAERRATRQSLTLT
jgi:YihY family inner membrane protein